MGRAGFGFVAALAMAGCGTQVYVGDPPAAGYTYYRDAKPVLDARCLDCHRDGESIPLGSYAEAYLFRDVVAESILDGSMPPRALQAGDDDETGESLTEHEVRALVGWVEQGGLMGDPADGPVSE